MNGAVKGMLAFALVIVVGMIFCVDPEIAFKQRAIGTFATAICLLTAYLSYDHEGIRKKS